MYYIIQKVLRRPGSSGERRKIKHKAARYLGYEYIIEKYTRDEAVYVIILEPQLSPSAS